MGRMLECGRWQAYPVSFVNELKTGQIQLLFIWETSEDTLPNVYF